MIRPRLKYKDGYFVSAPEKMQRGCFYCTDCQLYTFDKLKPKKEDFEDESEYRKEYQKFKELVKFNRKGISLGKRNNSQYSTSTKSYVKCQHVLCPYHELDKYKDYEQYLKATEMTTIIDALHLMS